MKTSDPEATLRKGNLPPASAVEQIVVKTGVTRECVLKQIASNSYQQIAGENGDGDGHDCTRDGHQDMK